MAITTAGGARPRIVLDDWSDVRLNDGVADATAVLAAALRSTGPGVVELLPGTYSINPASTLTMPDGTTIRGSGMGRTVLKLLSGQVGTGVHAGQGCTIEHLTIEGNSEASTTASRPDSGKGNILYNRVEFKNCAQGSTDGGAAVKGLTYLACRFSGNLNYGFQTANASSGIRLIACNFGGNAVGIALQNAPLGVLITGNVFDGDTTAISNTSGTYVTVVGNNFVSGTTAYVPGTGARNEVGENRWGFDELLTSDVVNTQTSLRGRYYGSAAPSAGVWQVGDIVHNRSMGSTGTTATGWQCTTAGTAGVDAVFQALYRGRGTLTGTATWDPGSLDNGQSETKQVTVTGAVVGDLAIATHSQNLPSGMLLTAQAIGSDLVDVVLSNVGAGTQDISSGTVTVMVFRP